MNNLEALRLVVRHLLNTGLQFKKTIEFHFYSAEEAGLLGSQDVFAEYSKQKKNVVAMLQQDMTGFISDPNNEHIGIIIDYTSINLTQFVKLVIHSYLSIPYVETGCGYACSDHASATKYGYPSAFVMESELKKSNKYIHTTMDTLDRLSFGHMAEFTKLAISVICELCNWQKF